MASSSPGLLGEDRLEFLKRLMNGRKLHLDQTSIDHLKKQALQKAQRLREQVSLTVPGLHLLSVLQAEATHAHLRLQPAGGQANTAVSAAGTDSSPRHCCQQNSPGGYP